MKGKISLEDLVEQFLDQCRSGNVPDIQDFAGAHPEFASELLALLPLVMEMEDWSVEKKQGIMPPVHDFPDLEGDDYRLIRRLGSGGMGMVFEALQLSLNRKVALKLLSPLLLQDAAQRILFEHEAHVISRLHHPNIVRIFSAACRLGQNSAGRFSGSGSYPGGCGTRFQSYPALPERQECLSGSV